MTPEGLIHSTTTLAELNELEQANILKAELWISKHKHHATKVMSFEFLQTLHKKMFDQTWKWAELFRKTNKNIGVDWPLIVENLKNLLGDVQYQISNEVYEIDELSARFHHRLVAVHPFANGNGRHARLATDVLLLSLNQPRFTWGLNNINDLYKPNEIRKQYIRALQSADKYNYELLLKFVRS